MTKKRSTLEEHAHTLADVPPKDFVRARNTLAGELKADDPKLAREVRALPRPSPAAWALGQVARHEHDVVEDYLDAAGRLRGVQTGRTKGGDLGEAIRLEREARQALTKHAGAALQKAGVAVTPTLRRQLLDTALAAATGDEATRDAFEAGELRGDLSPVRDLADLGLSTKLRAVPQARETVAPASPPRKEKPPQAKPRLRLVETTPTREEHAIAKHIERERERAAKRAEFEKAREEKRAVAAARKEAAAAHAHDVEEARAALRAAEAQAKAAQAEVARQRAELAAKTRTARRRRPAPRP